MHRASYRKSTLMAAAAGVAAAISWALVQRAPGAPGLHLAAGLPLALLAAAALLVAAGGWICLWRDGHMEAGHGDPLTDAMNRAPRPGWIARSARRALPAALPMPGDIVRVRSLAEVRHTLAPDGTLDGLPFMPEMEGCCGRRFRVHRRVDKINDMRHKTGLRRLRNAVTLSAVRCGGSGHDGCQAECQILWKDDWLERVDGPEFEQPGVVDVSASEPSVRRDASGAYVCQMTRLWESSTPMSRYDWRQDLRPVLLGNVAFMPWLALLLTRLFNLFQEWRGGVGFPHMPAKVEGAAVPAAPESGYPVGCPLSVRPRSEVAQTLVNNRTRGLWFDLDMIRFCGTSSLVDKRVQRVIHEATGQMVTMKTPSVILRDVFATGEFLRLCPQHEHIFWREAWLAPAGPSAPAAQHKT